MVEKVIILGSGPAGLSAAIYTAREGFEPLVIGGYSGGGQLVLTTLVENVPGFPEGIMGPDYMTLLLKQAKKFGTRIIDRDVTKIDLQTKPFKVQVEDQAYEALSVIIATGANAKYLGLQSEKKFMGRGVSSCATCDAAFFKEKKVIVVGGGDTAMEDSLFLTRFASEVTIVHRRDAFRASKIMQERALSNPKIKVIWNTTIEEIKGDKVVKSAVLKNVVTNQMQEMPIDGVFLAIGYEPNTKLFQGQLKTDEQGYLITKDEVRTDIDGVYVAGDVSDKVYRQAGTAAGSGIKAALCVRAFMQEMEAKH
ncbi:MAG: thioredoxin-disulfide reductase [Candidatus Micrarchaeota archaeon]|nr:thioredoxin-disulfide reductase [Candidatus Micrarchaeota archaeon]